MDRDEILRVFRAFEACGLEYILIGATAMGIHGVVRATEDLDLFIKATPENVERLRRSFREVYGDDPHIAEILEADLLGPYPALRYYPPTGDLYFDVMTRLGEAASFDTVECEVKTVDGTAVSVATPRALYRLKKGTVRPKDHEDAAALRQPGRVMSDSRRVQKFRSAAEMNAAAPLSRPSDGFDRFVRHAARFWALSPRVYPRGVFKFRTIDEAEALRASHRPGGS